jgi:5-methylcytosine-specific restriction endonuclease McrA
MKINRQEVYNKCGGHCAYCGEEITIKEMQVDHIIPVSFFSDHIRSNKRVPKFLSHLKGTDVNHIDNLFPSCRVCNKWKSAFDLEFFRSELSEQVRRLNDYSSNYRIAKRYGIINEVNIPIVFYFEKISMGG